MIHENELFLPFFLRPQDGSCHFLGTSKSVLAVFFKTARFIKFQPVLWVLCFSLSKLTSSPAKGISISVVCRFPVLYGVVELVQP